MFVYEMCASVYYTILNIHIRPSLSKTNKLLCFMDYFIENKLRMCVFSVWWGWGCIICLSNIPALLILPAQLRVFIGVAKIFTFLHCQLGTAVGSCKFCAYVNKAD